MMTPEQFLGVFIAIAAFGWVSLFGLVAWVGSHTISEIREMRKELSTAMQRIAAMEASRK